MTSALSRAYNAITNLGGKRKSKKENESGKENENRGIKLQFSEGDLSDEDNSEIVNILDRKQYH